jgi:opacity protein-like surface antigen
MAATIRKLNIGLAIGAVGLAAGAPTAAVANDDGMTVSLSGGAMQSDFTREKLGAPSDVVDDDFGLYGSVEILRDIKPGWDWSASASALAFAPNSLVESDVDTSDGELSFKTDFNAGVANFDIGRKWETARTSLRLGVGVEALKTSQDKGISAIYLNDDGPVDSAQYHTSRNYVGAGLRLSAEGKAQLAEDSPFSIYGGASAAATRGQYSYDMGLTYLDDIDGPGGGAVSESASGGLSHGTLDVGLEYAPTSRTAFRVGLRRDIFKMDSDSGTVPDEISGIFGSTIEADTVYVGVAINF